MDDILLPAFLPSQWLHVISLQVSQGLRSFGFGAASLPLAFVVDAVVVRLSQSLGAACHYGTRIPTLAQAHSGHDIRDKLQ